MSSAKIKLTTEEAKKIYHNMYLIRKFEEKCGQLYLMGYIAGFLHLYIGQEAVATGFNHLKNPQDTHITSYRCHAQALLQGQIEPKFLLAELTGRGTGSSKGKGGSMHIFNKSHNFYGGNGIVGAQIPLGTGLAFAHKYKKDDGVTIAYMGDGALPQGQVYEAFNMASLWKLPVVYVVENNQYSMGTPLKKTHANTDLYLRGTHFGITGERVEGKNIIEVMEKAQKAIEHVRSGKGPYLLEILTYRYRGHSMSDPQKYRSKAEVEGERKNHDPINIFAEYALKNNLLTQEIIDKIHKDIKEIVKEAEDFALQSEEPNPNELFTDVLL